MTKTKRLHFRRCHLCSGVSESEGATVDRCNHCGKPMAPFYFFNDAEVTPVSEFDMRPEDDCQIPGQRRPLRGFTAYW